MADQVNPTGSLAAGFSFQVTAPPVPRSAPEVPVPASTTTAPSPGPGDRSAPVSNQGVEAAVAHLSSHLQQVSSELTVSVDKSTGRTVYKVVDASTGSVVMQMPSEEILAMARHLQASAKSNTSAPGVLVDKEG
jgi:flagellar protein FlaG